MPELENSFPEQQENITPPQAGSSLLAKLKPKWPVVLGALGSIALFAAIIFAVYSYGRRGQEVRPTPIPTVTPTPTAVTVILSLTPTPAQGTTPSPLSTITPSTEKYITKKYECSPYVGPPESDKKDGYMVLVYPESVTVEEGPYSDCEFFLEYKKGSLRVTYTVGEAYPNNLDENYLKLKEENGISLVRNPLNLITKYGTNEQYYFAAYSRLLNDSECVANDFSPDLRPPCAMRGHPFVTKAGIFSVEISKDTTESERQEIMKVFDEIAIKSSGGQY